MTFHAGYVGDDGREWVRVDLSVRYAGNVLSAAVAQYHELKDLEVLG